MGRFCENTGCNQLQSGMPVRWRIAKLRRNYANSCQYMECNVHPLARVVVVAAIIQTLDSLHLKYPEVGPDKLKVLAAA